MPKLIGIRFCDWDFHSQLTWALEHLTKDSTVFSVENMNTITKEEFCFIIQELIFAGYALRRFRDLKSENGYKIDDNTLDYIHEQIIPKWVFFDNEVEECYRKWGAEYLLVWDNTGYKPYTYYME